MKIKRGNDNGIYAVFENEEAACKFSFVFRTLMRRHMACFGGYFNAWRLI